MASKAKRWVAIKPKVGNLSMPIKDAFEVFMKIFHGKLIFRRDVDKLLQTSKKLLEFHQTSLEEGWKMESKNTQVAFFLGVFADEDNNLGVEVIGIDHVGVRMFGAKVLSTT